MAQPAAGLYPRPLRASFQRNVNVTPIFSPTAREYSLAVSFCTFRVFASTFFLGPVRLHLWSLLMALNDGHFLTVSAISQEPHRRIGMFLSFHCGMKASWKMSPRRRIRPRHVADLEVECQREGPACHPTARRAWDPAIPGPAGPTPAAGRSQARGAPDRGAAGLRAARHWMYGWLEKPCWSDSAG